MRRLKQRATFLSIIVVLPACGGNPLSPSSLAGSWSGTAKLVECQQIGGDSRSCGNMLNASASRTIALQLMPSGGNGFSGVFSLGFGQPMNCAGSIDGDVLRLSGKETFADTPSEIDHVRTLELSGRPSNGDLTVDYSYTIESTILVGLKGPYRQTQTLKGTLTKSD